MSLQKIVKKLEEEINGKNRAETIERYEKALREDIEELSIDENFFNLPLKNIFSVISKVDFNDFDENDRIIEIIKNIIKNLINIHKEEKETILILQNLNLNSVSFSTHEEIFPILESITNCPILVKYCDLYNENKQLPEQDFDYQIQQKEKEIENLKQELLINNQSKEFEHDIFKACRRGNLANVQMLIEKEKVNKKKRVEKTDYNLDFWENDTPIHIAAKFGHLPIVQYLIEKQNVDEDINGKYEKTALHYACEKGHYDIVKYLISKGANINLQDQYERTPLHYAYINDHDDIAKYLISNGANTKAKDRYKFTPINYKEGIQNNLNCY